jgi:hypothetical protein
VFPEGVFDFFAALLQVGFDVVARALSRSLPVASAAASLPLPSEFLGSVMDLLTQIHGGSP